MNEERPDQLDDAHAIALIGMSGRFPGAPDVHRFWENIKAGVESITHFTDEELEVQPAADLSGDGPDCTYVRAKGTLDDVDMFDARFFGYLPREAELMDPQQRIFLECAWETMENAGYDPGRYPGSVGVFAGCYIDTYLLANLCSDPGFLQHLVHSIQVGSLQTELGNDKDYIATRVSFKLNLRGPSMTVQTACSTSLVAIAQACQSLVTFQADMALAGGVTITLPQRKGYYYTEGGMLSADGHCRAFSDRAQGTVFSNGAAVVLLKRLSDAVLDGDTIHAVIRGWAVNNDGGAKLSYTAPSVEGQAEAIAAAQALAGVSGRTIGYIEAHGTATPLGDPIEVAGLTRAFRVTTEANGFCAIGSVKTNLGHLDVASGAIGLIKTALALRDGVLPPSLNFERPNPKIDFDRTPFYVNTKLRPWPSAPWARRAGVSSFGVGGTNAHVVMEEPPPRPQATRSEGVFHVLPLSAKSDAALDRMAVRLADHLEANEQLDLADVAWTLQVGRRLFDHRRFVACNSRETAIARLRAPSSPATRARQQRSDVPVTFIFPGQGAQYPGMTKGLYLADAAFRSDVDHCAERLRSCLSLDLRVPLYPSETDAEAAAEDLRQTAIAQPALFVVQYAIARRWMRLGVVPDSLIGHSVGEFTAACVSGVLTLDDALTVVAERGRLMQSQPSGVMIAVRAAAEGIDAMLPDGLSIAAINAPGLCVVSGPAQPMTDFAAALDASDTPWSRLHTSHAFHSSMMDPAVDPLVRMLSGVNLSAPSIDIHSTATGRVLSAKEATDAEYWGSQLRRTVHFAEAVSGLAHGGPRVFVEAGAGQSLTTLVRQITAGSDTISAIPSLGPVQAPGEDMENLAHALGMLWLAGVNIDWAHASGSSPRRVPLPTYPFERRRFWIEPHRSAATAGGINSPAPATRLQDSGDEAGPQGVHEAADDQRDAAWLVRRQLEVMRNQLKLLAEL
jgi:phthiocerol/phenolphthiocerol synthesis type-I polyketide synthase E